MRHDTGLLGEGESRTIAARPDTVIPDGSSPAAGGTTPSGTATAGATPAPATGGGYDMSVPAQGGDVSTRPSARTAPEPGGGSKPRPSSSAPGVLVAPPGVKPVK